MANTTTFRWRHRFLTRTKDDRPAQLGGITEADEMYVLESYKAARKLDRPPRKRGGTTTKHGISNEQICIPVARDRGGRTIDAVVGKGALMPRHLHVHLQPRLVPDVLPVTDAHGAYPAFARAAGISDEAVNASAGVRTRGALHIRNVDVYHGCMRGRMVGLRGVASRYLTNYVGWRWALSARRPAHRHAGSRFESGAGQIHYLTPTAPFFFRSYGGCRDWWLCDLTRHRYRSQP